MDELLKDFIAETREMLEALGGEIVAWEAAPGDRARLDEIFRFVHTVKGNCGFFDLPQIEALSHAAEDVLADVRAGRRSIGPGLVSAVLAVIDRIGELVEALEAGDQLPAGNDDGLIAALSESAAQHAPGIDHSAPGALDQRKSLRSIRLSVDLLDRIMSGVSDMVLARNELSRRLRDAPDDAAVTAAFERVSACIAEMRDAITRTRMQRIDNLFAALPRMVRDLAADLGKPVTLSVDGSDVELDREMIEMIRDPLTHIVRNAIDHGIEPAGERAAAGKPAAGSLRVAARQSGNQILIEICDDGRGIDGEKLVRKAIATGILTAEQAERLSPQQRTALIFEPGLSTAAGVTAISGRGVGMDVVRANIERIGGVVEVEGRPGQGARLVLRVPLTLTIIPALIVGSGGRSYALPRAAIEEIVRSRGGSVRVETIGGTKVAGIRDNRFALVDLAALLGVEAGRGRDDQNVIVLKPAGGELFALAVDSVLDHEELVVKPASPVVMAAGLYAGTTLADDGSPILLLDPSGIAAVAGIALGQNELKEPARQLPKEGERDGGAALLFRTLGGARRVVPLVVVERIEDVPAEAIGFTAGRLRVALGGQIVPLVGCGDSPPAAGVRILRLSDGVSEIAYGFGDVVDIVALGREFAPAEQPGEVAGVVLIGGEQVEVIDSHWLFGIHGGDAPAAVRPVCALPAGDPWMANILRPIIEAAGYNVVAAAPGVHADLVITAADAPAAQLSEGGTVIRLRAAPDPADAADDSIYRYDRAGLLVALNRCAAVAGGGA